MKLIKVTLKNFRCFEELEVNFDEEHNVHVIIAENMVGKSALMESLRIAVGDFLELLGNEGYPAIGPKDFRMVGNNPYSDYAREASISTKMSYPLVEEGASYKYFEYIFGTRLIEPSLSSRWTSADPLLPRKVFLDSIYDAVVEKGQSALPLLNFTGTEYLSAKLPEGFILEKPQSKPEPGKIHHGYWKCLSPESMKDYVFDWLYAMEEVREKQIRSEVSNAYWGEIPEKYFKLFRKVVKGFFSAEKGSENSLDIVAVDWLDSPESLLMDADVRFEIPVKDRKRLGFMFRNQSFKFFDQLSDGYQYLVLLAGELAMRSLLINKHLGLEVNEQIPGVVLIDEFGVHLHPDLQQKALERLSKAFPKVQFIITTHSPLMLNGLKKEQVHILEMDEETGKRSIRHPDQDIIGLGAEGILKEVFGLESTFDQLTIDRLERYRELTRKRLSVGMTPEEKKEWSGLMDQIGAIGYDSAEQDPIYTKLLKKIEELNDLKERGSEKRVDEVVDEAIANILESWDR